MSGLIEKKIMANFSIAYGLEYIQTDITVGSVAYFVKSVSLKYLEVPILAQINFVADTSPSQWFLFLGPKVRYNVSSVLTFRRYSSSEVTDIRSEIRHFDIALEAGIGFAYNISPQMQVFLDGRYVFGLLDITTKPDMYSPTYTRDIRAGVGVKFLIPE